MVTNGISAEEPNKIFDTILTVDFGSGRIPDLTSGDKSLERHRETRLLSWRDPKTSIKSIH